MCCACDSAQCIAKSVISLHPTLLKALHKLTALVTLRLGALSWSWLAYNLLLKAFTVNHDKIHGLCRLKDSKGKVKLCKQEQDAARRREQMAAAAEARIARLQLISGQQQLWC